MIKYIGTGLFAVCLLLLSTGLKAQHYRAFNTPEELYAFYHRAAENNTLIIQGHRGTREAGLAENSIAAFEYVLERMPAIFEIDPRLTKDSVAVVFHDARLERTSNGTGKVEDYTWAELQKLRLKDAQGNLTEYKISKLEDVIEWARGKTILILDKKNVPLPMIADIIRDHKANSYVLNMVRSVEDALFYYKQDPKRMFSVSIRNPETYYAYIKAGIPREQMFACMGVTLSDEMIALAELLHKDGVKGLIAVASTYDKLPPEERAAAYHKIAAAGIDIIESDYPMELQRILKENTKK